MHEFRHGWGPAGLLSWGPIIGGATGSWPVGPAPSRGVGGQWGPGSGWLAAAMHVITTGRSGRSAIVVAGLLYI